MPSSIKFDLTDQDFGRLTVVRRLPNNRHNEVMWECHCECGGITHTSSKTLLSGESKSCGCLNRERVSQTHKTHGISKQRTYRIWKNMNERCSNPNDIGFDHYGGRGIGVCDEWRDDPVAFHNWSLENGYQDNLTIDRYPNRDGHYEPDNCRWVSMAEQNQNQSSTRIRADQVVAIRNDLRADSVIAVEYGVDQSTISRIRSRKTWRNID